MHYTYHEGEPDTSLSFWKGWAREGKSFCAQKVALPGINIDEDSYLPVGILIDNIYTYR